MLLLGAIFMTGCDASQIIDIISKVAEGVQKAIPAIKEVIDTVSNAVSGTNKDTADNTATQNTTNTAQEADKKENDASVIVINPTDEEEVSDQANTTSTSTDTNTQTSTTTETSNQTTTTTSTSTATQTQTNSAAPAISEKGQRQMNSVVDYAMRNHRGGSNGDCFNAVWGYLTSSGYGNLKSWGDLPGMGSDEARHFSEFMNRSSANLDEAGLQRLDTAFNPPITSPHDPRIPKGAVIVVAAGSYGTAHPTAGDIVIKAGEGRFINDGPNMNYGTASTWTGKLLGVYIPK